MMVSLQRSPLNKSLTFLQIVSKSLAVIPGMLDAEPVEIRKDHTNLVKFQNDSDDDFQTIVGHLSIMCENAQEKVARNWERWEEIEGV
jgi:hypothetical protein